MSRKNLQLGVADFAIPSPRQGSIEAYSGFGPLPNVGQEIHTLIQAQRMQANPVYVPEKWISHTFEFKNYRVTVGGRMDGYIPGLPPVIEEIKTAYQLENLEKALLRNPSHPYRLQLQTYAYIHFLNTGVLPNIRLHLVDARSRESKNLEETFSLKPFEEWIQRRLAELVIEDEAFEKLKKRRKKSADSFVFPFPDPRPGQKELIQTIDDALGKSARVMVQAPTGLGKTAAVTFPVLKDAMSRGQKAIYVTAKNSQHSVAEDAARRLQETGAKVKAHTLHAKSKMCLKDETLCNPEYCEFARNYYDKVASSGVIEKLRKKKNLTAKTFAKAGREFEVCPFELQMETLAFADLVICDYNYVFSPRNILGRLTNNGFGRTTPPNLIVDEAHNLPARANEYFSASLNGNELDALFAKATHLTESLRDSMSWISTAVQMRIRELAPPANCASRVSLEPDDFFDLLARSQELLAQFLASGIPLMKQDPVLAFCNSISNFAQGLLNLSGSSFAPTLPKVLH